MRLSLLDQAPISEGSTAAEALHRSVDLGRHVEALGYHRYWVAEHHGTPSLACAAPEVLIGAIADATERIRVGSGGVMLPHYSPLKVAEVFSMLSGLHPERIDLGIGRAPGHRSDDDDGAAARSQPAGARRLHRAARRAARAARGPAAREPPVREAVALAARAARAAGAVAARLVAAERASGPPSSACRTRSPTSSTRTDPRSRPTTAGASSTPSGSARRS